MPTSDGVGVKFVAGFGPVVASPQESREFYGELLGLPLEGEPDYYVGEGIEGVRHFGLWPLPSAAQSCFGTSAWPADVPAPTAWLELDVEDVGVASEALKERGCRLLVDNRKEPWGQTVTRLLSPEGILVGVTFTPWMRD